MAFHLHKAELLMGCGAVAAILAVTDIMSKRAGRLDKATKKASVTDKTLEQAHQQDARGVLFGICNNPLFGPLFGGRKVLVSPYRAEGHILAVGGSGQGKTSALLIPTLRSWAISGGKFIAIDISGDINRNVDVPDKIVFETEDDSSTPYNIFASVDQSKTDYDKDKLLERLAILLMPDDPNASDASRYYQSEGRRMLTAALIAFYHEGKDFCDICQIFCTNNVSNLLNLIDHGGYGNAVDRISAFEGVSDVLLANSKDTADMAISLFSSDKRLAGTVRRPKKGETAFDLESVEKNSCFIVIPDELLEYYAPLLMILVSQVLDHLKARPLDARTDILFCLDEGASFGCFDILPPLRKLRKRHVRIFLLTQSLADIDLTWSDAFRKAMMTNFKYKVVLECSEPDEQEYWAKLGGYKTTVTRSQTEGGSSGSSTTVTEKKDYAIEPATFANLGDDLILFYKGGFRRLHKNFYYIPETNRLSRFLQDSKP